MELKTNDKLGKMWLLYDGRYIHNQDRSILFEMCETLKEAKRNRKEYGDDTVIVECETFSSEIMESRVIFPVKLEIKKHY